jgi:hypothetical protein
VNTKRKPKVRRPPPEGYYTIVGVADYLGVARETVIRWNRLRTGPPRTMINGLKLYRRTSLDAWLARHEVVASALNALPPGYEAETRGRRQRRA